MEITEKALLGMSLAILEIAHRLLKENEKQQ